MTFDVNNCIKVMIVVVVVCIIILFAISLTQTTREDYTDIESKTMIHQLVDKVYVVCLDKRRKYIKDIMKKYNIKVKIIRAIPKDILNRDELIDNNIIDKDCELNIGRIACHLSHIKTLKKFLSTDGQSCLIFEDDLKPPDPNINYHEKIKYIVNSVPYDYDIIYFGRCWDHCEHDIEIVPGVVQSFFPQCRHAYITSREGAKKIINYTLPLGKWPGDYSIANLIKDKTITSYAATPPIFFQNRSEIGSELNNKDSLRECSSTASKSPSYISIY